MKKKVLITYDINTAHDDVKNGMIAKGYHKSFFTENSVKVYYDLPNTTLVKFDINITPNIAKSDLENVITTINRSRLSNKIILEKVMAVEYSTWAAKPR